jgi:hypothetical protein
LSHRAPLAMKGTAGDLRLPSLAEVLAFQDLSQMHRKADRKG